MCDVFGKATGAELVAAYVDPGSYVIEWDHSWNVMGKSLDRALDPEDEAASAVFELGALLEEAAMRHQIESQIRVLGGDRPWHLAGWPTRSMQQP